MTDPVYQEMIRKLVAAGVPQAEAERRAAAAQAQHEAIMGGAVPDDDVITDVEDR